MLDGAADVRDRDREERATAGVAEREAGRQRHGDRDRHRAGLRGASTAAAAAPTRRPARRPPATRASAGCSRSRRRTRRGTRAWRPCRRSHPRGDRPLHAEDRQIEHDREQDGQAARHQHVERKLMSANSAPRPPAPARKASAARPTRVVAAIRSPAMISGSASGSSTCHSSWRGVSPMPGPRRAPRRERSRSRR